MSIGKILNSLPGQFVLGGSTVSGISYLSNQMSPLIGGIFGGIPIGLPSCVFIDDNKVLSYLQNLSAMTLILSFVTILAYLLKKYKKYDKFLITKICMSIWSLLAIIYYCISRYKFF